MTDLFDKLKKMAVEPKLYALTAKSVHGSILHLGVHFTWDEAFSAAKIKMNNIHTHKAGENIDVDAWKEVSVREIITEAFDLRSEPELTLALPPKKISSSMPSLLEAILAVSPPKKGIDIADLLEPLVTVQDHIEDVKEAKNELLNKLIETGSVSEVESVGKLISPYEKKYVLKKIAEKMALHKAKLPESTQGE